MLASGSVTLIELLISRRDLQSDAPWPNASSHCLAEFYVFARANRARIPAVATRHQVHADMSGIGDFAVMLSDR
jgi:hypothetical protein